MKARSVALFFIVAALTFAAAFMAGCGEEKDGGVTTEPGTTPVEKAEVEVYFLRGEEPVKVVRKVKGGPAEALQELLKGPNPEEEREGITTAIPEGTRLIGFKVKGSEASADFSGEMLEYGGGSAIVLAITEQVTQTVLSNDARVGSVKIFIDGVPAEEALQP